MLALHAVTAILTVRNSHTYASYLPYLPFQYIRATEPI